MQFNKICSCLYEFTDLTDAKIRWIFGHTSNCPNFSINKDNFEETFSSLIKKEAQKIKNLETSVKVKPNLSTEVSYRMYTWLLDRYFPIVPNIYLFNWESDLLAINKTSKFTSEYEIKISRGDFKQDFKKVDKHQTISDSFKYKCNFQSIPNYFYYVTPPGLLDKKELPEYSGLIEVGVGVRVVKKAPILHKQILQLEEKLLTKGYFKFWNLKKELR